MALSFDVGLEEHVLPVEGGVGELGDPVAEDEHAAFPREHDVEFYMPMSIDVVVDVGVGLHVFFRVTDEVLALFTQIGGLTSIGMFDARMFGPVESQLHAPPRMHEVEHPLAGFVVEHLAQELELRIGIAESVAVGKIEHAVVDLDGAGLAVQDDAAFLLQIAVGPQVVVAREIVHFDPVVGKFGELSEETRESLGNDISVFVPEIEHVAEQIDGCGFVLDAIEEAHEASFLHSLVGDGKRTEMCVGEEIYGFHIR